MSQDTRDLSKAPPAFAVLLATLVAIVRDLLTRAAAAPDPIVRAGALRLANTLRLEAWSLLLRWSEAEPESEAARTAREELVKVGASLREIEASLVGETPPRPLIVTSAEPIADGAR